MTNPADPQPIERRQRPFRRAVLRGLALIMPPLLTLLLLLWAWNTIENYVLTPLERSARYVIVWNIWDVKDNIPADTPPDAILVEKDGRFAPLTELLPSPPPYGELRKRVAREGARLAAFTLDGREYVPVAGNKWIPEEVADEVVENPGDQPLTTPLAYYQRYVDLNHLRRSFTVPVFLAVFILSLYFLGKFLAAGVGRMLWNAGEAVIHRLPIISMIYSSMKQITDFVFSEKEFTYTRVVAVEYPRKGVWALGFVTGDGPPRIREAAGEPVVNVLVPTSPMPATGFTAVFLKREVVELDLTVDQALQFLISGGVVTPTERTRSEVGRKVSEAISRRIAAGKE